MAIKVGGTTVIDDSRQLTNISSVDATTVSALNSAGIVSDIVADTTPQLGGNLDVNGNSIVSVSNGNISITPNGTGTVVIDGLTYPKTDGAAGQFLSTNGSGSLSFTDAGGGAWALLSTVTASNSATVVFEDLFTSEYTNYAILAEGIVPATNGQELYAQYKVGGSYVTSGYQFIGQEALVRSSSSVSFSRSTSATEIRLNSNTGNASGRNCVLKMMIFAPLSSNHKLVNFETYGIDTNTTPDMHFRNIGTLLASTSTMTGIKFYMDSGNIQSGTFRLYGIKNS
jgi:hypothetical protein